MDLRERILNRLQRDLPLVREPYELLAAELACREADVLAAIQAARAEGLIREIAGIFEATAVGYRRALVAMRIPAAELDRAGQLVAGHPGVSHCYARSAAVNLWLTLAVSPRSRLGLERTAEILARDAGADWHALLPTLRRYKLQVRFDAATGELDAEGGEGEDRQRVAGSRQQEGEERQQAIGSRQQGGEGGPGVCSTAVRRAVSDTTTTGIPPYACPVGGGTTNEEDTSPSPLRPEGATGFSRGRKPPEPFAIEQEAPEGRQSDAGIVTDEQIRAIRALQIDLPARRDPFAPVAAAESLDPDMLLVHAADFLAAAWMRRYAAMLRHASAGAKANLLVAWQIDEAAADAAGRLAAQSPAVSHCYLRPALPDWPYNLYTMIHGRSREDCELAADEIMATTGLSRRSDLWTEKEYKKRAVRLFSGEEQQWEAERS